MPNELDKSKPLSQTKQIIHDLNNIFTSTLASTEILENLFQENQKASRLLRTIKTNSLQAIDIINSISNNRNKQKNIIEIVDVIANLESTIKPTLPRGIKLSFRFGKYLDKVNANYTDLYRSFLNLLVNAVESINNTGSIIFSVKNNRSRNSVIISIKDSGVGISPAKLKNIFNEGYSSKKRKSNLGLGLTIVKEIIEDHRGSINVISEVNSGTEFIITLPSIKKIKIEPSLTNSHKILLADDDKIILELFSELLETYNYEVITALDGKIALNKFKKTKFDLVIIDKMMPFVDGLECIKHIRNINLEIPIILTTGSQEVIEKNYTDLNINRKIKKPWSFDDMLEIIKTLLD
ncbi:MAG: response regulator [Bacteroidetes bacterium]|nr:response regulator [Bacteroidota bacterium]MBU1113970.1 response regulator [Bacteroidota bacterium]MBU1797302.1 response regulator [Bacteroidota bacterium]